MDITKIVITGGPCAGKSTAMSRIQKVFAQKGHAVLFVPETATELITGGVAPWTCGSNIDYQKCQLGLQLEKEKVFYNAAMSMRIKKTWIKAVLNFLAFVVSTALGILNVCSSTVKKLHSAA